MIISNSFFVQVIEDGSMLRGEIRSTQPLAQAYSDGTCVPNWAGGVSQPTVYIVLQNGASWILPDSTYKWRRRRQEPGVWRSASRYIRKGN